MLWLLLYVLVGFGNLVEAHKAEKLTPGRNYAEWTFYVLLWPVQLLFAVLLGINFFTEVVLGWIFNGREHRVTYTKVNGGIRHSCSCGRINGWTAGSKRDAKRIVKAAHNVLPLLPN